MPGEFWGSQTILKKWDSHPRAGVGPCLGTGHGLCAHRGKGFELRSQKRKRDNKKRMSGNCKQVSKTEPIRTGSS